MSKGRLFVVSGPSGSGKDTILLGVFKRFPDIKFSISTITRPMRCNEKPGEKYNFVSKNQFEDMLRNNELLEYNTYLDNYYGTPKAPVICAIANGEDIIVEVDVNGAYQIKNIMPDCISIFIMPPSFEVLNQRLRSRGTENEDRIKQRLEVAIKEISRADEYDYLIINDDLNKAISDFSDIIKADRFRTDRNISFLKNYLNK
ncbi:MAG: guanylate kinase [Clostridia bacterium]|nr:guanylate kinase [Clostridia bacterium]